MSNYAKESFDYALTKARVASHGNAIYQPTTEQQIQNLLSYIEIAQATIARMSTDKWLILSDEQCRQRNRLAIEGQQQVIAGLQVQIDSLLSQAKAA